MSVTAVNGNTGNVGQEITLVSGAKLTLNANGTFDYNPSDNFNGNDSFIYEISNGKGGTDTAVVDLTINPVNDTPNARDDLYGTIEDSGPVKLDVLSNDSDPEGDPLSLSIAANPTNGTAVVNNNNTPDNRTDDFITYTPNNNYNGNDSFTYQISDGEINDLKGATDTATVNVSATPVSGISISNVTVNEGNVGATNASFTVTLDEDSTQSVTVNYATANDSATAPVDYMAETGTLTFAAGETTKTINVAVKGTTLMKPTKPSVSTSVVPPTPQLLLLKELAQSPTTTPPTPKLAPLPTRPLLPPATPITLARLAATTKSSLPSPNCNNSTP